MRPLLLSCILQCILFCSISSAAFGEIYQLTLNISSIDCDYCVREIQEALKQIPEVDQVQVFPGEDLVSVDLKKDKPFHACYFFSQFNRSKLKVDEIDIDVQGIFHRERNVDTIKTENGTIFHISNASPFPLSQYKDGDAIRVKGIVTNDYGFNQLFIREITWRNPASSATAQLPHAATFSS